MAQTLPVPPFPAGLPQQKGYPTRRLKTYKINSSIKQRPLVVAIRNVRSLQDTGLGARRRTALIACELARCNIDIAALSETRLPDEGSLVESGTGYTFFWSGLTTVARRIHGVGFAVRTALLQSTQESNIAIDERIMILRLPLAKNRFTTFVSVYSPTLDSSDDVKDRFYDTLYSTIRRISHDDKVILLGDFNARVGRNHDIWHGVIGHHGVGNMNSSGLWQLSLCSELGLAITNTFFQLRVMHKTSWMNPRSKHWHLIDYVIVRRRDLNEVQITRAMRGTECSTDHCLIRSTLRLTVRPPARRQKPRNELNVHAAHNQNIRKELRNAIDQSLSHIPTTNTLNCNSNLTMEWQALSSALLTASQSTLGNTERRHQDWFDDNATDIRSLIHDKNAAHDALLRNPTSRTLRERFSSKRATVQRKLSWMENKWWAEKAVQIQSYANINDTKSFYEALKAVYGSRHFSLHPVRSIDGDLIKNKELILERWAEYLQNLLNKVNTTDPGFLDDLPTLPFIPKLDDAPSFDEMERAILRLKDNKAACPGNIPPEVIKHGGCALHRRLHNFILDCWSAKCLPQQWKNANIILVHKQKGDRAECGNSRGISLLSVSGKVLAKIMLTRLLEHVVDLALPESQCGFRRGRSTIDMIFVGRQLQEKCREQHQGLYLAFVDLTKAFDTVNRDLLETFYVNWLSSHFHCHTTIISYRYVCSSCHGWISDLQLSC